MPIETRVKPASRSLAKYAGVTDSGLASVVISTSAARPNRSRISSMIRPRCSAGSSVGVPPPKKTVDTGGIRTPSASPSQSTSRARRTSCSRVSA